MPPRTYTDGSEATRDERFKPTVASILNLAARAATDATLLADLTEQCRQLAPLVYDQQRRAIAQAAGLTTAGLDGAVRAKREDGERSSGLVEVEPWPEPVDGQELLKDIAEHVSRFVAAKPHIIDTAVLFEVFTHAFDAFTISPRLLVSSPEKQCGKSVFLEVLASLSQRPLLASSVSDALLPRVIEKHRPTLILDELDTFNLREREGLAGILNSGHRRDAAYAWKTAGEAHDPVSFSTWAPYILGGIGRAGMPDPTFDRCIVIPMERKPREARVERRRRSDEGLAKVLAAKAARWALDNLEALRTLDERDDARLDALPSARAADNWRPLLSIAMAVGADWPQRALAAAEMLSGVLPEPEAAAPLLLADMRAVFLAADADRILTRDLIEHLLGEEFAERPWSEWRGGRSLKAADVAKLLTPYGIKSRNVRTGEGQGKGYVLADLTEAFERYTNAPALDSEKTPSHVPTQQNKADARDVSGVGTRPTNGSRPTFEGKNGLWDGGTVAEGSNARLLSVSARTPDFGDEDDW